MGMPLGPARKSSHSLTFLVFRTNPKMVGGQRPFLPLPFSDRL